MKTILRFILLAGMLLAACTPSTPAPVPPTMTPAIPLETPIPSTFDWLDPAPFQAGLADPSAELPDFARAPYYLMNLDIAEDMVSVNGSLVVRYTNQETTALNEIVLRLMANLLGGRTTVAEPRIDGIAVTPALSAANSVLTLPLPGPLEPGGSVLVSMGFATTVPTALETNYGVLAYYDNVLALAHYYPQVAVYDEDGWSTEIPSEQGDLVYADASYYYVTVQAPAGLTLVTSGVPVQGPASSGGRQTGIYAVGPARDFYLALSPDFERQTQEVDGIMVNSYAPAGLRDGSRRILDIAVTALRTLIDMYGPYPYNELDLVGTPTYALGIEYPGMIAMTNRLYDPDTQFSGGYTTNDYLESTVAHEVAHQWFYNLVGNDQLNDPWLDEALSQYVTLKYFVQLYGAESPQANAFHGSLESRWMRVNNELIPIGLPVSAYQGREYGAIVYGRGGLFFEELNAGMGEDAYNAFMQEYLRTYSWGIATPEGLQAIAEGRCGCDLDALFAAWVNP